MLYTYDHTVTLLKLCTRLSGNLLYSYVFKYVT